MFLATVDERNRLTRARLDEIRRTLSSVEVPPTDEPGVTNGLRLPFDIRDRLIEIQGRHGMRSIREATYKAMILGLITLERLEPVGSPLRSVPRSLPAGHRVLSEEEVVRLKDDGFLRATR